MPTFYRGMVKKRNSNDEAIPIEWSGEVFYTQYKPQLIDMIQHMQMMFPQNEYTTEEVEM